MIRSGNIDLRNGYLQIKDQTEPIRAFNLAASIKDNKVSIDRANLLMGKGRLRFFNDFDEDPTNHFFVGFLDLGIFKLGTDEPGLLVNIPEFTAPRTLSKVMLKGRNDAWFTVSGPFDDMNIVGDVVVSDAQALYPPRTDNLLNLVYSFRGALTKSDNNVETTDEPIPLPFKLDLIIKLEDNIRYVTYPASMDIKPGGFLHLVYDGNQFIAKEAAFNSEKGKIDFLGTVFEAEYLNISIVDAQDLFIIDGAFTKRSPDGTMLAYSTDVVGDERYTIRVKDLGVDAATGQLHDEVSGVIGGATWDRAGESFYYTTVDDAWRSDKVWRHRLGTTQAEDELVHHETDERFFVGVGRSRSDRFIVVASGSKTTSEYRFLDADAPEAGLRVFAERREGLEYSLDHAVLGGEDRFLVLHNATGPDFEVGTAPVAPTPPEIGRAHV